MAAGADRRAVPEAPDPGVDLARAPLHRDPPGNRGRSRPVVARLGDHGRRDRVGRHGAAGRRRDGRRRRLGERGVPAARRGQGQPLPQRGDRGGGRGDAPRARATGDPRVPARAARPRAARRSRPAAPGDAAGRPGDRLAARRHGVCAAPDPRRRRRARRARRTPRAGGGAVRRACGGRAAAGQRGGGAGRADRHSRRCGLPRDRRRRGLDHAPEAPRRRGTGVQASGGQGARRPDRRPPGGVARSGSRRCRRDLARHPLRGGGRRRLPALPLLQRGDGHRPLRAAARGARSRQGAPDPRDRVARRAGLLVERHPLEPDRGGRRSRPTSPGATSRR